MQTLSPPSAAAQALIETIQAEARSALLADIVTGNSITVLQGIDPGTRRLDARANSITLSDAAGNEIDVYRHAVEPDNWRSSPYMQGHWHPARWYGSKTLKDGQGHTWRCSIATMVQDDFGNLVEVAA